MSLFLSSDLLLSKKNCQLSVSGVSRNVEGIPSRIYSRYRKRGRKFFRSQVLTCIKNTSFAPSFDSGSSSHDSDTMRQLYYMSRVDEKYTMNKYNNLYFN